MIDCDVFLFMSLNKEISDSEEQLNSLNTFHFVNSSLFKFKHYEKQLREKNDFKGI